MTQVLLLEQERAKTLAELPELVEFFFRDPESYDEKGAAKWFAREGAAELLAAIREALAALPEFTHDSTEAAIRTLAEARGEKVGPAIHTARLAVTGQHGRAGAVRDAGTVGQGTSPRATRTCREIRRQIEPQRHKARRKTRLRIFVPP